MDTADSAPIEHESLWATVKADLGRNRGLRLLAMLGLLLWMAFQWGWGNDILLPPIVARAFDALEDGERWISGLAAVAGGTGAGGLFWGITQAFDGLVMLTGLRLIPGLTARISRFLRGKGWIKPFAELSFGTKFLISYASGASVLCLVDVFATGQPGLRSRRRMLAEAVALSVAGVAFAISVVLTLAVVGARVPATTDTTETLIRYARNPLTWLVLYGSIIAVSAIFSKFSSADE